jgi:hypothetical protein
MNQPKDSGLDLSTSAQSLLRALAETGKAIQLASLTGGLTDLTAQWVQHVEEAEGQVFQQLVADGPAADGPVGFCLAEHAALGARLAGLAGAPSSPEWLREAELLIGRLIQHLFLEARILQPLLERTDFTDAGGHADQSIQGRGNS